MEIVCPDCDARYRLPDGQIAPGRRVGCARCGRRWTPIEQPAGEPERQTEAVAPAPLERDRLALVGWLLTIVVLVLLAAAAWHLRARIEHLWPPSTRIYRLLGA